MDIWSRRQSRASMMMNAPDGLNVARTGAGGSEASLALIVPSMANQRGANLPARGMLPPMAEKGRESWPPADDVLAASPGDDDRLPVGLAGTLIILISLGCWALVITVALWLIRVT